MTPRRSWSMPAGVGTPATSQIGLFQPAAALTTGGEAAVVGHQAGVHRRGSSSFPTGDRRTMSHEPSGFAMSSMTVGRFSGRERGEYHAAY